jgi:hypothetical protein
MNKLFKLFLVFFITSISLIGFSKGKEKFFNGMIIDYSSEYIELKRKDYEATFYFTDKTIIEDSVAELEDDAIELCQRVEVYYVVKNKRREIIKIIIIKDFQCQ